MKRFDARAAPDELSTMAARKRSKDVAEIVASEMAAARAAVAATEFASIEAAVVEWLVDDEVTLRGRLPHHLKGTSSKTLGRVSKLVQELVGALRRNDVGALAELADYADAFLGLADEGRRLVFGHKLVEQATAARRTQGPAATKLLAFKLTVVDEKLGQLSHARVEELIAMVSDTPTNAAGRRRGGRGKFYTRSVLAKMIAETGAMHGLSEKTAKKKIEAALAKAAERNFKVTTRRGQFDKKPVVRN